MENQRIIRQENPEEEAQQENFSTPENSNNGAVIHSNELDIIYNEWILAEKGDLIIDEELCEKLKSYIEYQKRLKPLKQELAMELIEKYIVPDSDVDTEDIKYYQILVNDNKVTYGGICFFKTGGSSSNFILLKHFKYILAAFGNKIISYLDSSMDNTYINLRLWVLENGYQMTIDLEKKRVVIVT